MKLILWFIHLMNPVFSLKPVLRLHSRPPARASGQRKCSRSVWNFWNGFLFNLCGWWWRLY